VKGLVRLDEVRPENHVWIWGDRIARKEMHFLAGRPDTGKGMMLAKIAADVSLGRDPLTGKLGARSVANPKQDPLRPMNVLYSAAEDSAGTMVRPRLEAQGARRDGIHLQRFRLPLDFAELTDIMIEKQIDLLIMDPLASHLSGGVNRYGDSIRMVTDPLKELLELTDAACIVVDHVKKNVSPNADPMTAVGGGSSGFPAACRMGFLFGRDPSDDEKAILGCIKHNIREKPMSMTYEIDTTEVEIKYPDAITGEIVTYRNDNVPKLMPQGEDYFSPIKLVASDRVSIGRGRPADKRSQACEWLTGYLWRALQKGGSDYPVLGKQVQEDAMQFGMSYRTLRRAADDMKIVKSGRGGTNVTWALPQPIIDMLTGETESDHPADTPEVAQPPVEEPQLEKMLDQGDVPSGDPTEWERNKKAEEPEVSPEFDAEFDSFLANLGGDGDEPQS
jgi:hypothetical protein